MKKLLLSLMLFSSSVIAKDMVVFIEGPCKPTTEMHEFISKYEEKITMNGRGVIRIVDKAGNTHDVEHILNIYVNHKTFAYTIIAEFSQDNISCLVTEGDDLQPFRGKSQI